MNKKQFCQEPNLFFRLPGSCGFDNGENITLLRNKTFLFSLSDIFIWVRRFHYNELLTGYKISNIHHYYSTRV